ncbi:hypothetical protein [Streptomyces sp. R41]|uniref:Uncharacterized protein n=1 Tax=Streptomyces sp. R41 TaxID=3238632 RepID=A0AB39RA90_9ACTN
MILLSKVPATYRNVEFLLPGDPLWMILLRWPATSGAAHARKVT